MRLDPVPVVAGESPVSHVYDKTAALQPVWTKASEELIGDGSDVSKPTTLTIVDDQWLHIVGDETKYGNQIVSAVISVEKQKDYVFHLPFKSFIQRFGIVVRWILADKQWRYTRPLLFEQHMPLGMVLS